MWIFPVSCGRLPATARGYKQGCFESKKFSGDSPQVAGDFRNPPEVTNTVVLNKRSSPEVTRKLGETFGGLR